MADNPVGNSISGVLGLATGAGAFIFLVIPAFMGCGSQTSPINADIMRPDAWAWWMGSNVCRAGKTLHESFRNDIKPGGTTTMTLPDGTTVVNFNEQNPNNSSANNQNNQRIELPEEKPVIQQRSFDGSGNSKDRFKSFEDM
jgi:hypothetical protein